MIVVGIDPSNRQTGLACVDARPGLALRERLIDVRAVPMFTGDDGAGVLRSMRERVHPILAEWAKLGALMTFWVEQAPPTARADAGHGAQGEIGWAQGWCAGLAVAPYVARFPVHRAQPGTWRDSMQIESAQAGLLLQTPDRRRAAAEVSSVLGVDRVKRQRFKVDIDPQARGAYLRRWDGCAHVEHFADFASLRAMESTMCPSCHAAPAPVRASSEADRIRAEWKACACRFVSHFWPTTFADLVKGPAERAKSEKAPHELAGVADACEAVGIAVHGSRVFQAACSPGKEARL